MGGIISSAAIILMKQKVALILGRNLALQMADLTIISK